MALAASRPQHDVGGVDVDEALRIADAPLLHWELHTHALLVCLAKRGLMTTDEMRRVVEALEPSAYAGWPYYGKWASAMSTILLERGVIAQQEIADALGVGVEHAAGAFAPGDRVRVRNENAGGIRWRKPHLRVPGYIFGLEGVVDSCVGSFSDPELLAFRIRGPQQSLYRVAFRMSDIAATCYFRPDRRGGLEELASEAVHGTDTIVVDVYASWLERRSSRDAFVAEAKCLASAVPISGSGGWGSDLVRSVEVSHGDHEHSDDAAHDLGHDHGSSHTHGHEHSHGHVHEHRDTVECTAIAREDAATGATATPESLAASPVGEAISTALVSILDRKGIVPAAALAAAAEALQLAGRRFIGADLVARAWTDPDFKRLLLTNATAAAASVGVDVANPNAPTVLVVVESTPELHNLVVCTLCSCYPTAVLGLSPAWYKSRAYRSRAVRDPRALLAEFGTRLPPGTAVRVHDSTADCRYMVLPVRPAGTDGWAAEQLRGLVTRDSLIGVTVLPDVDVVATAGALGERVFLPPPL